MTEEQDQQSDDPGTKWVNSTFSEAIKQVMNVGMIPEDVIEARAIWALPGRYVIGQVRDSGNPTSFYWVIAGEVPTDVIGSDAAVTARDAARYFTMKWQTFAGHLESPEDRQALGMGDRQDWPEQSAAMVARAESLYEIAEDDSLWPPPPSED